MVTPPPRQDMEYVTGRQKQILLILDAHREGMALRQIRIELAEPVPDWELKNELAALKKLGLATNSGRGRGSFWSLK